MIGEKLATVTPKWAKKLVPQAMKDRILGTTRVDIKSLQSFDYIQQLMLRYQLKDLVNVDSKSFRSRIDEFLRMQDAGMEGFQDPAKQRDLSIKFHWAHDHDFGGGFSIK